MARSSKEAQLAGGGSRSSGQRNLRVAEVPPSDDLRATRSSAPLLDLADHESPLARSRLWPSLSRTARGRCCLWCAPVVPRRQGKGYGLEERSSRPASPLAGWWATQ